MKIRMKVKIEEIEMKVYEDVGNRAVAQACWEDKKEEKSEYKCKFNAMIERKRKTERQGDRETGGQGDGETGRQGDRFLAFF
jgi:hypothetical protein